MQTDDFMMVTPRRPSPKRRWRRAPAGAPFLARAALVAALIVVSSSLGRFVRAQEAGKHSPESGEADPRDTYQRKVQIPAQPTLPSVVMTEFFTHGELDEKA